MLSACQTTHTAVESASLRNTARFQRDSIYLHDSTAVIYKLGLSNNVLAHGLTAIGGQTGKAGPTSAPCRVDTLLVHEWHTRWRDRETIKTDTLTQTVTKTETVPVRYVPSFYKYCTAFAILVLVVLLLRLARWFYKKRPFVAGIPLVHVPKLCFSRKYSGSLRSPQKLKFPGAPSSLVGLVISCELDHPIPRLQRLATARGVLLGLEGFLVRRDLRDVFRAGSYCRCNSCEALASSHLVSRRRSGTLHLLTQVQTVTIRIRGSRYAVGSQEHLVAAVLPALTRFAECAGD